MGKTYKDKRKHNRKVGGTKKGQAERQKRKARKARKARG